MHIECWVCTHMWNDTDHAHTWNDVECTHMWNEWYYAHTWNDNACTYMDDECIHMEWRCMYMCREWWWISIRGMRWKVHMCTHRMLLSNKRTSEFHTMTQTDVTETPCKEGRHTKLVPGEGNQTRLSWESQFDDVKNVYLSIQTATTPLTSWMPVTRRHRTNTNWIVYLKY